MTTATKTRPRGAGGRFVKTDSATEAGLRDALGRAEGIIYDLEERTRGLGGVDQMLDEPGWHPMFAHEQADDGISLKQVRFASKQLRELLAGNPLLKRGSQARLTYVWGGGVQFGAFKANGDATSLTTEVQKRLQAPGANWRYVFSNGAHEELERAAFTDGNIFLLGDDGAKTLQRVAMDQITADLRNPENLEEIWMLRREWDKNPYGSTPEDRGHTSMWFYTDAYEGTRKGTVQVSANSPTEPVDRTRTMLHLAFNPQAGWAYGIPDGLPVIAWLKLYREFLTNGYVMSKALAQIAFKVTSGTALGASRAAAEFAAPGQGGATASLGNGNDLTAVSSAGKGYDFASGKPIAAAIAAGLEISVETLLAGQITDTLDITARLMATMRRLNWDDHFARVLAYLGSTRQLRTTWADLPVEQIQRQMQAWTLTANTGLFEGEVVQAGIARTMKISNPGDVPEGYKPGPQAAAAAATDDTDPGTTGAGGSTDGTGQGQGDGNPTGNNDSRDGGTD